LSAESLPSEDTAPESPRGIPAAARAPVRARALWLVPFAVFALVLWLEAEVPSLPSLEQGPSLWRALGDSALGTGFEGILSQVALADVLRRLGMTIGCFGLAWLAVRAAPRFTGETLGRAASAVLAWPRRRYGLVLFLATVLGPLAWFFLVRGLTPRLGDEIAYLFQSRLFSGGLLTTHSPVAPRFYKINLIVRGGRWFSQYPPGHPLVLAPGWWIGSPWLICPLAGGISALAIWRIAARLCDEMTGRLAGVLMAVSPFAIFLSGSYLSHATCLMLGSLACLGLLVAAERAAAQGLRWKTGALAAIAGGCLGLAGAARPLSGIGLAPALVLIGLVAGVSAGVAAGLPRRRALARVVAVLMIFGALMAGGASLAPLYNSRTTGHALVWGYQKAQRSAHELGFGRRGDLGVEFTPERALFNTRVRWRWLDGGTLSGFDPVPGGGYFFWPFPFLILPLGLLARGNLKRNDLLLAAIPVCLTLAYFPYYYLDICWGPRFLYESAIGFLPLTARGAIAWAGMLSASGLPGVRTGGRSVVTALLAGASLLGLTHAAATGERLYDTVTWPTRRVDQALTRAVDDEHITSGLVFVSGAGAFYETAWRRMFVDRRISVMFAKDLGVDNSILVGRLKPSNVWVARYNGDEKAPIFDIGPWTPPPPEPGQETPAP